VVLEFVKAQLPDELDRVYGFFRRNGAYGNYKYLLAEHQLLEAWYEYEEQQTKLALQHWGEAHDLEVV